MKSYTNGQRLAILIGAAATIGAIALLLSDALGGHYTIEHGMVPLVVLITVASGHLVSTAIRDRKVIAAFGFALAFVIGTAVTVLNGVGRQTEGAETKAAAATAHNTTLAAKLEDLKTSRQRLGDANRMVDHETRNGGCGRNCQDWRRRASEVQSHISVIEAEVGKLGGAKPVNAKAEKAAQIAALFGGDHDRVKAAVTLLEPVMVPFLLEWVAIVALGFGFGHRGNRQSAHVQRASVTATVPATVGNDNGLPPTNGGQRTVATKAKAEADVIRLVARGEELPNQETLAERWGVHKGTASKWLGEFERRGVVTRTRDGRSKRVAAA